jgi:stage V sporulation protein SpoVS
VAAVPDPVVSTAGGATSAAFGVPDPVAHPAASSKRRSPANGGKKKKRKANHAKAATTAKKRSKTTSERGLPTGVYKKSSGKFFSQIWWDGKTRQIGTFDTPEQASAAYVSVKKNLDNAELSALGADEVNALFDAAQKKAVEAVGGFIQKKRKSKASSERGLPQGVSKLPSGKFKSQMMWGGKTRHIGTFDTPEEASAAYISVQKERDNVELSALGADEVNALFNAAQKRAVETVGVETSHFNI